MRILQMPNCSKFKEVGEWAKDKMLDTRKFPPRKTFHDEFELK